MNNSNKKEMRSPTALKIFRDFLSMAERRSALAYVAGLKSPLPTRIITTAIIDEKDNNQKKKHITGVDFSFLPNQSHEQRPLIAMIMFKNTAQKKLSHISAGTKKTEGLSDIKKHLLRIENFVLSLKEMDAVTYDIGYGDKVTVKPMDEAEKKSLLEACFLKNGKLIARADNTGKSPNNIFVFMKDDLVKKPEIYKDVSQAAATKIRTFFAAR